MKNNGPILIEPTTPKESIYRRVRARAIAFEDQHPIITSATLAVVITAAWAPVVVYASNKIQDANAESNGSAS